MFLFALAHAQNLGVIDASTVQPVYICPDFPGRPEVLDLSDEQRFLLGELRITTEIQTAEIVSAGALTPTLDALRGFDAVLVSTVPGQPFADPDALGDVLRDYQLEGHGVIVAGAALDYSSPDGIRGGLVEMNLVAMELPTGAGMVYDQLDTRQEDDDYLPGFGAVDVWVGDGAHVVGLQDHQAALRALSWAEGGIEDPLMSVLRPPEPWVGSSVALNISPNNGGPPIVSCWLGRFALLSGSSSAIRSPAISRG